MRPALPALLCLCAALAAPRAHAQRLIAVAAPSWPARCDDLDLDQLADAAEREVPKLKELAGPGPLFGKRRVSALEYAEKTLLPLAKLARRGRDAFCALLPRRFSFFQPAGGGTGKVTAYHHPIFRGSRTARGPFQHPLYRRPPDPLAQLTTAEILRGGLSKRGLELVYLDQAVHAHAAHVEGSARVELVEGGVVNLTTDGHNGGAYENVSRMLLRDGKLPKDLVAPPGMTRVQKYFLDHPDELLSYWAKNPHFVYFQETALSGTGKFGELVPGRSLAVDLRHVPLGAAIWLDSEQPVVQGDGPPARVPLRRVGLAQDTGAAILGPARIDVFFGAGEAAQQAATLMNRPGRIFVLLSRPAKAERSGVDRPARARYR